MKTSNSTPRPPRKRSSSTTARVTPAVRKVTSPRVRRSATTSAPAPQPSFEAVRLRAYEIYLERNGHGDALSHWLEAERELLTRGDSLAG
jgi:hypothetical protein